MLPAIHLCADRLSWTVSHDLAVHQVYFFLLLFSSLFFILLLKSFSQEINKIIMKHYYKYFLPFFLILAFLVTFLTGCAPSAEMLAAAQDKYTELVQIHNEVVEVHKEVDDTSYDDALSVLQDDLNTIQSYNLKDMSEEEITLLMSTMDTLIASYQDYLAQLGNTKKEEDAAELTAIPLSLTNNTSFSFDLISLYPKDSAGARLNLLSGLESLSPTQSLTGLQIKRNAENTPWMLTLETTEGVTYDIELPVETYTEDGVHLYLAYDSETGSITV